MVIFDHNQLAKLISCINSLLEETNCAFVPLYNNVVAAIIYTASQHANLTSVDYGSDFERALESLNIDIDTEYITRELIVDLVGILEQITEIIQDHYLELGSPCDGSGQQYYATNYQQFGNTVMLEIAESTLFEE